MIRLLIASLLAVLFWNNSYGQGQITIHSSNGYDVKINLSNLVLNKTPYPGNPNGGCNYTITMNYTVVFSGPNQPGSLWTLQGYVRCNESSYFDLPESASSGTVTSATASYNGNPANLTLSMICNKLDIEIQGPGISYSVVTIPIGGNGGGALPIELLDFKAQANGQQVDLTWSTGTERDNDYFTIEKTTDGINYETVAQVAGAGSSTSRKDYAFTDYAPSTGTSYYRLKQTDYNGATELFEVIAVEIAKTGIVSNVFPNPATDSRVSVSVAKTGSMVQVNLYNLFGQLVSTQTIDAVSTRAEQTLELPENGSTFIVELVQNNELIARHKVLTTRK